MPVGAQLDATVETRGDATILRLGGVLDRERANELQSIIAGIQDAAPPRLVIDMAAANYIDSAVIAVFVGALQRALHGAGFIVVSGVHGPIRALIEMTKLDQTILTIASTVEEALAMPNVRRTRRVVPSRLECKQGDVLDISSGGMRLQAARRLEGEIDFALRIDRQEVQVRGAVVWSMPDEKRFVTGVRFLDLDDAKAQRLAGLLGPCRPARGPE